MTSPIRRTGVLRLTSFPAAIADVADGKRIARKEWANEDYGCLKEGFLVLNRDGKWFKWIVSSGDLLGDDWFIVE